MGAIARIDSSPMNAARWVITLECGHEEWVTAKKRPARRRMKCTKCEGTKATPAPQSRPPSRTTNP